MGRENLRQNVSKLVFERFELKNKLLTNNMLMNKMIVDLNMLAISTKVIQSKIDGEKEKNLTHVARLLLLPISVTTLVSLWYSLRLNTRM